MGGEGGGEATAERRVRSADWKGGLPSGGHQIVHRAHGRPRCAPQKPGSGRRKQPLHPPTPLIPLRLRRLTAPQTPIHQRSWPQNPWSLLMVVDHSHQAWPSRRGVRGPPNQRTKAVAREAPVAKLELPSQADTTSAGHAFPRLDTRPNG